MKKKLTGLLAVVLIMVCCFGGLAEDAVAQPESEVIMPSIPQVNIGGTTYDLKDKRVDNLKSALMNIVSLQNSEAFKPKKNWYDPELKLSGYYIDNNGKRVIDPRYALYPIIVPAGKIVFTSGRFGTNTERSLERTIRQNCVFDDNWNVISVDMNENTAYKYQNTTGNRVIVIYSIYVNHPTVTVNDLMIQIVNAQSDVNISLYEACQYIATDKAKNAVYEHSIDYDKTTFLEPKKNYYDPSKILPGYYVKPDGTYVSDNRYAVFPISVPAGKTVYSSGRWGSQPYRQFGQTVRQYTVIDSDGSVVASDDETLTAYKYANETGEDVVVLYSLYYNHPSNVISDLMIQIADNGETLVLDDYEPFILRLINVESADVNTIKSIQEEMFTTKDFFEQEINDTALSVSELTKVPCLTYNIITDTHVRPSKAESVRRTYDSLANIHELNKRCFADGVVHLGDMVDMAMYNTDGATNAEIYTVLREYIKRFTQLNNRAYIVNGNHDGIRGDVYQQHEWYSVCGRLNEEYTVKDSDTNYFYVDYPKIKTRCVFMAIPDNIEDAASHVFGYTTRCLNWLVSTALDTPDGYGVIMFAHVAPCFTWYMPNNRMENLDDFYGICSAYNSQSTYTGTTINADFTSKNGTKLVAYICGHAHGDAVLSAGETVQGVDQNWNPVETTNGLPCPLIVIGCGLLSSGAMSNFNAVAPERTDRTITQDLWDTMVYRPDQHKIYMIRFGAGNDRTIPVA